MNTSTAAYESIRPHRGKMHDAIMRFIESRTSGATCDEAEVKLGYSHQSCSARFRELKQAGRIVQFEQRPTRSGRAAWAYVVAGEIVQKELF